MTAPLLRRLARDQQGATLVEFALITPPFLIMLMGLFDLTYNQYTSAMLNGAIQKAARDSSIEGAAGSSAAIDAKVTSAVQAVSVNAALQFDRKNYTDFANVSRGEDFNDLDSSGVCDNGEAYEDSNGNGKWDADAGTSGFGTARDAVLYTVTVTYRRAFPIFALMPGQDENMTLRTSTVLRNQPYGQQNTTAAPTTGNCA